MIKSIAVPNKKEQKYYHTHYLFFIELVKAAGVNLQYYDAVNDELEVRIDDKRLLIDYCDHSWTPGNLAEFDVTFKFHYSKHIHAKMPHIHPLTPISFYDWNEYHELQKELQYIAESNLVLNNQKPGAGAKERREKVQAMLAKQYGENFDISITSKPRFWHKVANCLVSVCVPGARNNMLDRGQLQYWAFGACTISPKLDILLPHWREPMPGMHYVRCTDDYSDLIEKIEWCRENRDECKAIGSAAKDLFLTSCTPERIWAWIEQCLEWERR